MDTGNPAAALNDLLTQWEAGDAPSSQTRGMKSGEISTWHMHVRAVELIREVERSLDGLDADGHDVSSYRECVPEWYATVFSFEAGWRSKRTGVQFSAESSRVLRSLATLLNVVDRGREVDLGGLLDVLDDAEDLIRSANELTDAERRYLLALIIEARRFAEDIETFGDRQVRRVAIELGGAISAAWGTKTEVTEESRNRVVHLLQRLFSKAGWKVFDTGLNLGSGVIEKALEQ